MGGGGFWRDQNASRRFCLVEGYMDIFGPLDTGEGCLVVIVIWFANFQGYSGIVHIFPSLRGISECITDDDKEGDISNFCDLGHTICNR